MPISPPTSPPVHLHFRQYGNPSAAKLIILHGLFGGGINWRSVAMKLAATHHVYCPDLRNHGQSAWHREMDYAAMADDIAHFIAAHNLHQAVILGHSMGGKIAMTLALDGVVNLAGLIVVDIAPVSYSPDAHRQLIDAMLAVDLTAADRKAIDAALARQIDDVAIRQFLAQSLRKNETGNKNDKAHYRWQLNLAAIRDNLAAISGFDNSGCCELPALFIGGGQSDYITADAHTAIYQKFPNARIETIANAGHWLHAEQPEALLKLCNAYLGDI